WPGKIKPNSITDHVSYFGDLMATVGELTGASVPTGLDSISFLPTLLGKPGQLTHEYLYWEFYEQGGKQALRSANWKAVRIPMFNGDIELYNLDEDLGESKDVSQDYPVVARRLEQLMNSAHLPNPNWKARGKSPKKRPAPGGGKTQF
ncbi:N-acetylgalactosamine-6-sulfatase, partial [Mariniblastus sp.]|nr:N-acetylgalactosamine-6-sulfatase [Mariniblastus sp.]